MSNRRNRVITGMFAVCATAASATVCLAPPAHAASTSATIAQIQGAAHRSPLTGRHVQDVTGVVTAADRQGFWMQSLHPDGDPATSEGIYVFTHARPSVATGDVVQVAGTVSEFRPGGYSGHDNLTTTELSSPSVAVTSTGHALPTPVVIGVDRVAPQQTVVAGDPGSVEYPDATFDPSRNALDFDESLEGMRVGLQDAQVVGPTQTAYGETAVVPGQHVRAVRSPSGGVVYGGYDEPNAMRLTLDTGLLPKGSVPAANVGDSYRGATTGIMGYDFGTFHLMATSVGTLRRGPLRPTVARTPSADQLTLGTFNVENLDPTDPAGKFDALAGQLVANMKAPDIVALEEVQDDDGPADDGVVDSTRTTDLLIAAIRRAGGPAYRAAWVNPVNDRDGGQPGGNIRQVLLYRVDHGVSLVRRAGGTPTAQTVVTGHGRSTSISHSPGRIAPNDPAWDDSRKPLVAQFTWRGAPLFVIANHFASKGGDDPLMGRWQQPVRFSQAQRDAQAQVVRSFTDSLLKADAQANVVTLGDLNDFEFSPMADIMVGSGATKMTDLPRTLPAGQRYTYVYEGNSQVLDHILLSPSLADGPGPGARPYQYQVVHTNAEFSAQESDHDPQVVRLSSAAVHHR